jgi:hypothetical protein
MVDGIAAKVDWIFFANRILASIYYILKAKYGYLK